MDNIYRFLGTKTVDGGAVSGKEAAVVLNQRGGGRAPKEINIHFFLVFSVWSLGKKRMSLEMWVDLVVASCDLKTSAGELNV